MKYLTTLLSFAILASCAPKAVRIADYQPQAKVEKQAALTPAVHVVREASSKADSASAVTADRIASVSQKSKGLLNALDAATAEADRQRKQKSATEAELESAWQQLNQLRNRARDLFAETEAAKSSASEERRLRQLANDRMTEMEGAALTKDIEVSNLHLQLADAESGSKAAHEAATNNANVAAAEKSRADSAEAKAGTWIKISIVSWIVAAIALFLAIKF
jgi:ABC-type transporter Mla subunit MlaD